MELLDVKLAELDDAWSEVESIEEGAQVLPKIMSSLGSPIPEQLETRLELCAADLEWLYRRASPVASGFSSWSSRRLAAARKPRLPISFADYSVYFGGDWSNEDVQRRVILAEWRARSAWGDEPSVSEFANGLPSQTKWKPILRDELDSLARLRTITTVDKNTLEQPVCSQFEIGRQNTFEPPAPCWLNEQRRLVVANLDQISISRRQLVVCRSRMNEVRIENCSRNVSIKIHRQVLRPGGRANVTLPVAFSLGDIRVAIQAGAPMP